MACSGKALAFRCMSMENHGGIVLIRKIEEDGEKPDPEPLCPPQIPHGLHC
jgi:hypothetical protein